MFLQIDADVLTIFKNGFNTYKADHGRYPPTAVLLIHEFVTNLQVPDIVSYFRSLNYTFVNLDDCLDNCLVRSSPDQPAWLADPYACWDPYNPTDYSAGALAVGQDWLPGLDASILPVPPPLGMMVRPNSIQSRTKCPTSSSVLG